MSILPAKLIRYCVAACVIAIGAGGCKSKQTKANAKTKANGAGKTNASPDAAVPRPLPPNTAGTGFSLPVPSVAQADKAITVVDRGKGKPVTLALGFKAGDKQTLQMLMTAKVGDVEARSELLYNVDVLSVQGSDAAQTAMLKLTFVNMKLSAKPDQPRSAEMAKVAAKIAGQSVRAKLTSRGKATVVATDPQLATLLPALGIDAAGLFSQTYPRFPSGNLGVGAKWLSQLKTTRPSGVIETIDLTYELSSAATSTRGLLITVDMVGKIAMTGNGAKGSGNLRAQITMIPSRGLVTKATVRQDVRIRTGGQSASMSMLVDVIEKSGPR